MLVRFDDDSDVLLDLTAATKEGPGAALADPEYLARVNVDSDRRRLVWPNGFEVDIDVAHATGIVVQRQEDLGPEHPETLAARFYLACLYFADGDKDSARAVGKPLDDAPDLVVELAARVMADAEREFGHDDPRVQALRDGIREIYREAGLPTDDGGPDRSRST